MAAGVCVGEEEFVDPQTYIAWLLWQSLNVLFFGRICLISAIVKWLSILKAKAHGS